MNEDLPAITGKELIKLLEKAGWQKGRKAKHGRCLTRRDPNSGKTRVAFIPEKTRSLPKSTLGKIIGPQQMNIGRNGLLDLIKRFS